MWLWLRSFLGSIGIMPVLTGLIMLFGWYFYHATQQQDQLINQLQQQLSQQQRWLQQLDQLQQRQQQRQQQLQIARETIITAPPDQDAPLAPILANTLEELRHAYHRQP